ncbi:MAG TPA: penicillin-binding protein [Vicinamibacterales bacterium]|jgi:cell division protein FtsI (penicillin-binding protein 3)|nr:penicillin-binding protein [Vicinamibacterales bacterium]
MKTLFSRLRVVNVRRRAKDTTAENWKSLIRMRLQVVGALLAVWAVAIQGRLVFVQVADRADLEARARDQQEREIKTLPMRGEILDRNGKRLATTVDADSYYVDPSKIADPEGAVKALCRALGDCTRDERESLLKKFKRNNQFASVRRRTSPEQSDRIRALALPFVYSQTESARSYPGRELAAHVVGWVSADNEGQGGIEHAYNKYIRGREGRAVIQIDGKKDGFNRTEEPAVQGSSIELTIDEYIQHLSEQELHRAIVETRANSGSVIVTRPQTGEILAMASEPTFDLNLASKASDAQLRNRAVQDSYEPGSTFKLVTASAAIEEHVMPIDALIDTSPGQIRVSSNIYHDTSNHGVLSFADVIADSSNVGAIKVGQQVRAERLFKFVQRYGFGTRVSPDFRSENPGRVYPLDEWTDLALASISIGYQVGVTPLQMVAAVGAIANGGRYVEPRVVRAVYTNVRQAVQPKVVRQAIAPETAAILTGIMEGVVDHGTATKAQIPGFTIAGKTGTAARLVNGHYSKTDYNASFVGFVPSTKPELAIIVVIDTPRGGSYYGGTVSAPVFQRIAVGALRYLGIGPTINPAPPVLLARAGARPNEAAVSAAAAPEMKLVVDVAPGTLPDFTGMTLREASQTMARLGVNGVMLGDGFVVSQKPAPGTPLTAGVKCELTLVRVVAGGNSRGASRP